MYPPVGKSGPGTALRADLRRRLLRLPAIFDERDDAVDDLAHVVRRDVRRHADGDAGRSVDQQVRERRRQDRRFFGRLVEVGDEVDSLLVEIAHHLFGELLEPRFGVAIGRRRIAVDRTEVPLAVDQEVAHVEVLRQPDERVVGGSVAVRMEVADDFADDLRALAVRPPRRQAHRAHRIEHAPVGRLEAVANVRQRPPDDYAHGVIHVRALHLVFDVDGEAVEGDVSHKEYVLRATCHTCDVLRATSDAWHTADAWHVARCTSHVLDVQVLHVERVVFDELAAGLDLIAHQAS